MPDSAAQLLLRRLSGPALAEVVSELSFACLSREDCAPQLQSLEQSRVPISAATSTTGAIAITSDDEDDRVADVKGMDAHLRSKRWSFLFGTPFYQTSLAGHADLNRDLMKLLRLESAERRLAGNSGTAAHVYGVASTARSLVGNGWRTDDTFLRRRDPSVRELHRQLLAHAHLVAQRGQSSALKLKLKLNGWAIWLGAGGYQREHVHPMSTWSGVYYISAGRTGGKRGGCLKVNDPRPGAQMVLLGKNDEQFMESRQMCPHDGLLVMFPSWLSHSVTPYELDDDERATASEDDDEPRVAVAFNVQGGEV